MNFAKIVFSLFFLVHVKVPMGDDKTYRAESIKLSPEENVYILVLKDSGRTVYVPATWTIIEER